MDFKFEKGYENDAPQGQDKGRQTILLIVLLLLLGGFGYLYFFTGLIRPQEQPTPPTQPVPQMVKQPLPAREGASAPAQPAGAPGASTPAAPPAVKPAPSPSAPGAAKPVKPTKSAVPAPSQQPAVKAKAAAPSDKADTSKAGASGVQPAASKTARSAHAEKPKTAATAKKATARTTAKRAAASKPAAKAKPVAKLGGPWTLVVGSYVLEDRLAADMAKVKGIGLSPAMTSGQRHLTTMYRLKYGEYADQGTARQAVELLKNKAGDGFAIQKGGRHEVFAGSYAQLESARTEQQRLAAIGIKVGIQKSQVGVPTRKLTAGTFTNRAAADGALKKLKLAGIGTPFLE